MVIASAAKSPSPRNASAYAAEVEPMSPRFASAMVMSPRPRANRSTSASARMPSMPRASKNASCGLTATIELAQASIISQQNLARVKPCGTPGPSALSSWGSTPKIATLFLDRETSASRSANSIAFYNRIARRSWIAVCLLIGIANLIDLIPQHVIRIAAQKPDLTVDDRVGVRRIDIALNFLARRSKQLDHHVGLEGADGIVVVPLHVAGIETAFGIEMHRFTGDSRVVLAQQVDPVAIREVGDDSGPHHGNGRITIGNLIQRERPLQMIQVSGLIRRIEQKHFARGGLTRSRQDQETGQRQ